MDEQQLQQQIIQLVQAALQGNQEATQQIQQIMQAAQQGNPQAQQIAQLIQQVAQEMQSQQQYSSPKSQQGGVSYAKLGTKLNYIKQLRGQCPDGYEMQYFKKGGPMGTNVCKQCVKKKEKMEEGGNMPTDPVTMFKYGRKQSVENMPINKCGGKSKKTKINKAERGSMLNPIEIKNERARLENKSRKGQTAAAWEEFKNLPTLNKLWDVIKSGVNAYIFPENEHNELLIETADFGGPAKIIRTAYKLPTLSLRAKELMKHLSPSEQKNIQIMLKNQGRTLENPTESDIWEIQRLLKGDFKPSTLGPEDYGNYSIGATVKGTNRWAGGTSTDDW